MTSVDATRLKIKPEDNVWYLLATLYGQPREGDRELQARNRKAWNRYMAQWLKEDAKSELERARSHEFDELLPLNADEMTSLLEAFAKRHRDAGSRADPRIEQGKPTHIDFSEVEFDRLFWVEGFVFPIETYFAHTRFSEWANFRGAKFAEKLVCFRTDFSSWADFSRAAFREAEFRFAKFEKRVVTFDNAVFQSWADFEEAHFFYASFRRVTFASASFRSAEFETAEFPGTTFGKASFPGAIFKFTSDFEGATLREAKFEGAIFNGDPNFVNTDIEGPTSFESATFSTKPPSFFGAKLHERTVWRKAVWPLPIVSAAAGDFIDAYARLKLEMDRLKQHEDELDFFALELKSRRVWHGDWAPMSQLRVLGRTIPFGPLKIKRPAPGLPIAIYGFLCDYGRSYVRPLVGLLVTAGAGALPFWFYFGWPSKFWQALSFSFANTLGVLGFRKDFIKPEVTDHLLGIFKVIAAIQTVTGAVLLFLFVLAIRNRFRMK
jgi:uncharacterized protein YjbI with pentapeptide repeats